MTITSTVPRQATALTHAEAAVLATAVNDRFAELAAGLTPADWSRPTDCSSWDVRALSSHVLGMMEANVSVPRFVHDLRRGKAVAAARADLPTMTDGMTEVQVSERADLAPAVIAARLTALAPRAARARTSLPGLLRRVPMKIEVAPGVHEPWKLGYLFDTIMTRDTWMHRIDVSRAVGRPLVLTPEHDGRIVADVVAEWARRHGRPFRLHLEGPAGGDFTGPATSPTGPDTAGGEARHVEEHTLDAVEFCRILSGRGTGTGLLAQLVPF